MTDRDIDLISLRFVCEELSDKSGEFTSAHIIEDAYLNVARELIDSKIVGKKANETK